MPDGAYTASLPAPVALGDRLPPQNLDAERAVLGAMLLDADAANLAAEIVSPDDFYPRAHRIVFETLVRLSETGDPTDLLVCEEALRTDGHLESVGGAEYLRGLLAGVPSAANIEQYARLVKESAVRRHVVRLCHGALARAYDGSATAADLLNEVHNEVYKLSTEHAHHDYASIRDVIQDVLTDLGNLCEKDNVLTGLDTGYYDVNLLTGGFRDGELIILGGRPSCGKTTLALNISLHLALAGKPVALFSLEMTHRQLVRNLLSMKSGVSFHKEDGLRIESDEMHRILEEAETLANAPIFVDDSDNLDIRVLRARRLAQTEKTRFFVVDYLQLVRGASRAENRQQEISEISRNLKGMAKELECPILALSQLSRDVEKTGRRPAMADLRESGSIEQDADVVMLLSRGEDEEGAIDVPSAFANVHLEVAKNRNGRTGPVTLQFRKDRFRFENATLRSAPGEDF